MDYMKEIKWVLFPLAVLLIGLILTMLMFIDAEGTELRLRATKSVYVWSGETSTNYSASNMNKANFGVASLEYQGFCEFDLSSIPAGSTIDSAFWKIYSSNDSSSGTGNDTLWLYRNTASWVEATITWATRPAEGDSIARDSMPYFGTDAYYIVKEYGATNSGMKQWLQNIVDGTWTNYGFRVRNKTNEGNAMVAWQDRTNTNPDSLIVYYTAGAGGAKPKAKAKHK